MIIDQNDNTINICEHGGIWVKISDIADLLNTSTEKVLNWALSEDGIDSHTEPIIDEIITAATEIIANCCYVNTDIETTLYDAVFIEKPGEDGLSLAECKELLSLTEDSVYPLEIFAKQVESSAMGFISANAARKIDFDYTHLKTTIASILDDMMLETPDGVYEIQGLKVKISK